MAIRFERLVSRNVALMISRELDIAGLKMSVETILKIIIIGSLGLLTGVSFLLYALGFDVLVAAVGGFLSGVLFVVLIYMILEYNIDSRKTKLEVMLPDFLQITAANLRSGIALDRAMLLSARPEFTFLSDDVKEMNRKVFGGENFEIALKALAANYRSYQLDHAIKMMLEALRFGGAMSDLLAQISKDLRNQQLVQKELEGQLFLYSILIAFAALVILPFLYGLTSQMIVITDTVWNGILASNPTFGQQSLGISFLKPSKPQITPDDYNNFSLAAVIAITGFASIIMSAISSGAAVKGIKYTPVFIAIGVVVYLVTKGVMGSVFAGISGGI